MSDNKLRSSLDKPETKRKYKTPSGIGQILEHMNPNDYLGADVRPDLRFGLAETLATVVFGTFPERFNASRTSSIVCCNSLIDSFKYWRVWANAIGEDCAIPVFPGPVGGGLSGVGVGFEGILLSPCFLAFSNKLQIESL